MSIQRIISDKLPKAVDPIRMLDYVNNGWLYASGQLPIDPKPGMPATIGDQTIESCQSQGLIG